MTDPSAPTPTAQGSFAKTPLVHLLVYIADHGYSGSLILREPDQGPEHTIYFFEGMAAKFRTGTPTAHLGRVLFELGHISQDVLDESLKAIAGRGELHGEHLVRRGTISRATLMDALRAQSLRKMAFVLALPRKTEF